MNYLLALKMMTINEIIEKDYRLFKSWCRGTSAINGKADDDILHDTLITSLKHFNDMDIGEEEGIAYVRKTFGAERFFRYKRREKVDYKGTLSDMED